MLAWDPGTRPTSISSKLFKGHLPSLDLTSSFIKHVTSPAALGTKELQRNHSTKDSAWGGPGYFFLPRYPQSWFEPVDVHDPSSAAGGQQSRWIL